MAKLKDLQSYLNYEFSSGCYTGEDYKTFERKYINYLKAICKQYNWIFVRALKNHYEFSAFIMDENGKYAYMRISDVRFFKNEWYYHILIRGAKDDKDYHGGPNRYTDLERLPMALDCVFQGL